MSEAIIAIAVRWLEVTPDDRAAEESVEALKAEFELFLAGATHLKGEAEC